MRFSVEKQGYQSGAWQRRTKLLITEATRANLLRFQRFANENESLLPVRAEGTESLPVLPFSKFKNQSKTNSESTKSIVFRIDLLAILRKSLDRALFSYILYTRFD